MSKLFIPACLALAVLSVHAQDNAGSSQQQESAEAEAPAALGSPGESHAHLPPEDFGEVDHDGNGELGFEEVQALLPEDVEIMDANNDGKLNTSELEAAMPELRLGTYGESTLASEEAVVGEEEYTLFVQYMNDRASSEQASAAGENAADGTPAEGGQEA